eukprot:SAG11_NODE_1863_length_4154_cov_3.719359_6_plen_81_part_00
MGRGIGVSEWPVTSGRNFRNGCGERGLVKRSAAWLAAGGESVANLDQFDGPNPSRHWDPPAFAIYFRNQSHGAEEFCFTE